MSLTVEFALGIEPTMQPNPVRTLRGDCFACAMTSVLNHLFPDKPPGFDKTLSYFTDTYYNSDEQFTNSTWRGMDKAIINALRDGYKLEHRVDMVRPVYDRMDTWSYAFYPHCPTMEYAYRLEGWFRCGWVALAEINMAGKGAVNADGTHNSTDHFVAIDGVRYGFEPMSSGGSQCNFYVHVICSVKGAYWIKIDDFIQRHGAAAFYVVRRDERG